MIIRNGFVSNSSTSSFMILGIDLDPDELEEKTGVEDAWDLEDKCDLNIESGYEGEYYAIGLCPSNMKDHETLFQFKTRICTELKKIGIDVSESELGWHEDAFMD